MQESTGVWWANYLDAKGNRHSFTLRQAEGMNDADFLSRIVSFQALLATKGYEPMAELSRGKASYTTAGAATHTSLHTAEPKFAPVRTELQSFEITAIEFAGKERWIVKGGHFTKFGVTCFKEVLERAGLIDKLDMTKPNTPTGKWIAFYQEKIGEDGKTKPDKIVNIERGQ